MTLSFGLGVLVLRFFIIIEGNLGITFDSCRVPAKTFLATLDSTDIHAKSTGTYHKSQDFQCLMAKQDFQSLSEHESSRYGLLNFKCLMTNHAMIDR